MFPAAVTVETHLTAVSGTIDGLLPTEWLSTALPWHLTSVEQHERTRWPKHSAGISLPESLEHQQMNGMKHWVDGGCHLPP